MENDLRHIINQRVLIMDGAMGTMIQRFGLTEEDYRGERFRDHHCSLKGNNDLLVLTKPGVITQIHLEYLEAGADIIETDTFNANRISLADYGMEDLTLEMNREAARLAAGAVRAMAERGDSKPRWVAGSVGPTNKTASMSPDVRNPAFRAVTFDDLYHAYREQVRGLLEGGVDLIIVETIFDTLNAKAALMAAFDEIPAGKDIPVIASVTISDNSGRTLSGQTLEAFLISVMHFDLFAIGLNCSLGAAELRPYLKELSAMAPFPVVAYPNAGLPNQFGEYDQSPSEMASLIRGFLDSRFVNMVGGCCGTTPEHIRRFAESAHGAPVRPIPLRSGDFRLSGLEPLMIFPGSNFINIGERTNVSGSRKFARLIREAAYEEALSVARQQVENGAQILDISMDEAMLDAVEAMTSFLRMIASDPDVAKVPLMVDSSRFEVIVQGLKCIQGKAVVNSISLKEGEQTFREQASLLKKFGVAVVVMAFDEEGQATTFDRRIAVCRRAYQILTEDIGFSACDIIFDPNILTIATGMEEHNPYAVEYLRAVTWIRENLPDARISGGISNLSFSFRGNDALREAMHSVFLYHAIRAGLDMGIVNAGALPVYDEVPGDLIRLLEDVILNRRKDAAERLLAYAETVVSTTSREEKQALWRQLPVQERLQYAMIHGIADHIDEDIDAAATLYDAALDIIEGPLMAAMNQVGDLFGSGKMFLPQVVKSARVMKKAVSRLTPRLEAEKASKNPEARFQGHVLLATVKGDVHDIGKNIVGVVLACNNYHITDLGVMVPADRILDEAIALKADVIGLSGLITPSLGEMVNVAAEMERRGMTTPLLIGGATTSELHTAIRITPHYSGSVIHVRDASKAAPVVAALLSPTRRDEFSASVKSKYQEIATGYGKKEQHTYISLPQARSNRFDPGWSGFSPVIPAITGTRSLHQYPLEEIRRYIDWTFFFHAWKMNGKYPAIFSDPVKGHEAKKLYNDANEMLDMIVGEKWLTANGVFGLFPCNAEGDDVIVYHDPEGTKVRMFFRFLRNQQQKEPGQPNLCLADFIAPVNSGIIDYIGGFAVTAGLGADEKARQFEAEQDDYRAIMVKILADRLAEAFAELLHEKVRREFWGYQKDENLELASLIREEYAGIRPAPGYPACPEHSEKSVLFDLLNATPETGISLTGHFAMHPGASVSGLYFAHPEARYFNLGKITREQVEDYARRKGISPDRAEELLNTNLNYIA